MTWVILQNIITDPADPKFEETINLIAHEQMHRWGVNIKFKDESGNISTALLGKDGVHWSYLLDTDASVMYGNDWRGNGDGTFTSTGVTKYYSPLDLYLMGIYDKKQVPPMILIDNPSIDPAKMPEVGAKITGTRKLVTIDDIIAVEGERIPDASASQKTFKIAYILLTRPNTYTGNELKGIENIRNAWAGRFRSLTYGKATIANIVPSISIFVSSPADGETINGPDVMVKGAIINSTGNETGITVNGRVATMYGNQFIANNIPLTEGLNTITVTATDTDGNTETTSITVNAVTTGNYIRITSDIESGIAPLEVSLRIDGSFSIEESNLNITGPIQPEILSSSPEEYTIKLIAEGIYYVTVSATGPDGNVYQDTIGIIVMNKAQMDRLLQNKWEVMKMALGNGNINSAVNYFAIDSRNVYTDQFSALEPILSEIVNELNTSQINMESIEDRIAGYEILVIREGTTYSFHLKFTKDVDGLWKIWSGMKTISSFSIVVFVLFLSPSITFAGGPWKGKIIDIETKEPIEGAVVLAVWERAYRTPAGDNTYFYEAKEVLTDKEGNFEIPAYRPINLLPIISYIRGPNFTIFKPGYLSLSDRYLDENIIDKPAEFKRDGKIYRLSPGLIELPKLKTREERLKTLPSGLMYEEAEKKVKNYMHLINVERRNLGLDPIPMERSNTDEKPQNIIYILIVCLESFSSVGCICFRKSNSF